jgi:hypothetical protein
MVVMPSLRVLLYSQKQSPNNPNNGGDKWNHQHSPNKTPSVRASVLKPRIAISKEKGARLDHCLAPFA